MANQQKESDVPGGKFVLVEFDDGREAGMSQFLDEKSFRPGLGTYRRAR